MKKRFAFSYLMFLIPMSIFWLLYSMHQFYTQGFVIGFLLIALSWSLPILCIPAAHGRMLLGLVTKFISSKPIFCEPCVWAGAVALNIAIMVLHPELYHESVMTSLLHRIIILPEYWVLFAAGAVGAWYRFVIGHKRYVSAEVTHTLIRHLILMAGVVFFFFITKYDLIIILNALANG